MKKKICEIKPGEVFEFGEQNWIKLEEEGLALMKDILEERAFDEESNDWRESGLRKYLNDYFYETLTDYGAEEKDFLMIETDLTADDGTKNYGTSKDLISLMTADLHRSNRHLLKLLESWWWLATPRSCLTHNSYTVRCSYSSGTLSGSLACYGYYGVRPLIKLKSDTVVEVEGEDLENTESLFEKIKKWSIDRNLHEADPCKQMLKLTEETGELAEGIAKNRPIQIEDSIGDIVVVLTVLSLQLGLDIEECMRIAYNEIKDRKGEMVNGVFVKESDLKEDDKNE